MRSFAKGQQLRFKNIHRRKPASLSSSSNHHKSQLHQQEAFGIISPAACAVVGAAKAPQARTPQPTEELERLRKDKFMLMVELSKLGTEYYYAQQEIKAIAGRLEAIEACQQQRSAFFIQTMCSPAFLGQLKDQNGQDMKLQQQRLSFTKALGRKRSRYMVSEDACGYAGMHHDHTSSCEKEDRPSVSSDSDHRKLFPINLNADAATSMCSPELVNSMDVNESSNLCLASMDANESSNLYLADAKEEQALLPTCDNDCGTASSSKVKLFSDMTENVFMVDLNHPLSTPDEWDYSLMSPRDYALMSVGGDGQSALHGFGGHGASCSGCGGVVGSLLSFEGMESELFWEHLLGPSTYNEIHHSETRLDHAVRWSAI